MTFSSFQTRGLFDELRTRAHDGGKCPSLRWICKHSKLKNEEEALALLEQLHRDGVIVIQRKGPYPWVSVIKRQYTGDRINGVYLDPERWDQFDEAAPIEIKLAPADDAPPLRHMDDGEPVEDNRESVRRSVSAPAVQSQIKFERVILPPSAVRTPLDADDALALLAAIEAYCARTGIVETQIGRELFDHGGFVGLLRKRGKASVETAQAIYAAIGVEMPMRPEGEADAAPAVETKPEAAQTRSVPPADVDGATTVGEPPAQVEEEQVQARETAPQTVEARHEITDEVAQPVEPRVAGSRPVLVQRDNQGASGTSRADSGAAGSPAAPRIIDRAPSKPVPKQTPASAPAPKPAALAHPLLAEHRPYTVGAVVSGRVRDELKRIAAATGVAVAPMSHILLSEALAARAAGPQPPEDSRHRVRAAVVRAWRNDGRTFDEFVTALIDLGLESYLAFREAA